MAHAARGEERVVVWAAAADVRQLNDTGSLSALGVRQQLLEVSGAALDGALNAGRRKAGHGGGARAAKGRKVMNLGTRLEQQIHCLGFAVEHAQHQRGTGPGLGASLEQHVDDGRAVLVQAEHQWQGAVCAREIGLCPRPKQNMDDTSVLTQDPDKKRADPIHHLVGVGPGVAKRRRELGVALAARGEERRRHG